MTIRFRRLAWMLFALALPVASQSCVCLLNTRGTAPPEGEASSGAPPCEPGCFWLLGGAPIDGCGTMGGPGCDEIVDPDFTGCFQRPEGYDAGWIRFDPGPCNLLTGYGHALTELAPAADPWIFDGEVFQGGLTDEEGNELAGVADLNLEGGQELTAIRTVSPDGEVTLAIQGTGRWGEAVRIEMVPVACLDISGG